MERQQSRRNHATQIIREASIFGCIVIAGSLGLLAALLPELPQRTSSSMREQSVAEGELRFVGDAVLRYGAAHDAACPPSLQSLKEEGYLLANPIDPWGEPLLFSCVEQPHAFVVVCKGPDLQAGTSDDLVFAIP
jgi:hypothetical protein